MSLQKEKLKTLFAYSYTYTGFRQTEDERNIALKSSTKKKKKTMKTGVKIVATISGMSVRNMVEGKTMCLQLFSV